MRKTLITAFIAIFVLHSCKPNDVIEVKETSLPAEHLISSISEVYSTFDVLDDFISSNEFLFKKDESLIPSSVLVNIIDSSFIDGDGVRFILDFGSVGSLQPHGVLCKDNKYRAGKIFVEISAPYAMESELVVSFDHDEPFYSGDGSAMYAFTGEMEITKDLDKYQVISDNLTISSTEGGSLSFICDNVLEKTSNPGTGILNDVMEIDGSFQLIMNDGSRYEAEISEDLVKNYTYGCVRNIVEGEIKMELDHSASDISANFDPYEDSACDNLVEITINGKSFIHQF